MWELLCSSCMEILPEFIESGIFLGLRWVSYSGQSCPLRIPQSDSSVLPPDGNPACVNRSLLVGPLQLSFRVNAKHGAGAKNCRPFSSTHPVQVSEESSAPLHTLFWLSGWREEQTLYLIFSGVSREGIQGQGCSSAGEYLPSMNKALGSIPSEGGRHVEKKKRERKKNQV